MRSVKSVLIVDDDKIVQLANRTILVKMGYDVFLANNGVEALRILNERNFDLILLDINMPILSGIEMTRELRQSSNKMNKNIFIIGLTANTNKQCLSAAKKAGMDFVINKPLDTNLFEGLINSQ